MADLNQLDEDIRTLTAVIESLEAETTELKSVVVEIKQKVEQAAGDAFDAIDKASEDLGAIQAQVDEEDARQAVSAA
ncbi:MAG: hypothetical protein WCT32_04165 [Patescibacteria group bacterium]|jgi:chromosome segregation ATPase